MEFIKTGEKEDMIRLSDGKNSAWFEFMEMAVVDGSEYAALLQQGDDEPVILRLSEDADGREKYLTVDDDALFDKVLAALEENMEDDE